MELPGLGNLREEIYANHVEVFWLGQTEPTKGRPSHKGEAIAFFKIFPDTRVGNNPYKVPFGQGELMKQIGLM